ncbi:STAS domain-containing protein [Streptomyces sp. NPDC006463]|uniref:STAS domain-containing protein n=1 Tax=Streptomyces sp. NPDC006463 TaxID=3364746 RepID=UPI00369D3DB4
MVAHSHPTGQISIAVSDGRAVLRFSGVLSAATALLLEEKLCDPILQETGEWVMDMTDLFRMDLTCAFALRRAMTRRPATASVRILHARRAVERTLRHVGATSLGTGFRSARVHRAPAESPAQSSAM